ncbi:MAG: TRAP transporter small permease [Mesorhizobium sp.]|nr:TRAP transporter small permease [Mesorhizobium sp.]MCO5160227.1 TRAP transporter small permease [Mesorhizobium sp.]
MTTRSEGMASLLNAMAAIWAFALAFVILVDVAGRLVGFTFQGTVELVANSIVAIVFLQFPLTIVRGSFLRATVIYDTVADRARKSIDLISCLLGLGIFVAIAWGGWSDMITSFRIGEFEGEGALRVPVYPTRAIIFAMSVLCAVCYLRLIVSLLGGSQFAPDPRSLEQEV